MPHFESSFDGAALFYRDYIPSLIPEPHNVRAEYSNESQPTLVFLHQWPLSSSMWEPLMIHLSESYRFRCIAPDRRGFGKSEWNGMRPERIEIDYHVLANDIVDLLEKLEVGKFVFIAASMGGGESLLAYMSSNYIHQNCQGFVWVNTSLPYPTATPEFSQGTTKETWDQVIDKIREDRAGFMSEAFKGPLGVGNNEVPDKLMRRIERMADAADALAVERSVQLFSGYDFSETLATLNQESKLPVLLLHGDSDAVTPVEVTARRVAQILPRSKLKVYQNASHILIITHASHILEDIILFMKSI